MRMLYVAQINKSPASGVNKKIFSQCNSFEELGYSCDCFFIINDIYEYKYHYFKFVDNYTFIQVIINKYKFKWINKIATILRCFCGIPVDVTNLIKQNKYDIIYVRHLLPVSPKYISFLKNIKNKAKVFNELFTYPYIKDMFMYKGLGKYLIYIFEFRSIERLRTVVDEFVTVVEIEDPKARERLGKHKIIPNGFDVDSVKIRTAPLLDKEIRVLGLANLAYWHGFDRIIIGMAQYTGPYKIVFHLAGGTGYEEIEKLRNLASSLGVLDNVVFHEPLYGEKLNEIFDACHVAAGALGIHRKELHLTSELKLREYCARGIPFFMSSYDPQFENLEHKFKVSEDDSPIDIAAICEFTKKVYLEKNHPELMHNFAKENIDWKILLKRLFD